MSARNELAGILTQWRQLTRAEGKAIQTSRWPVVQQIQAQKAGLRKLLTETAQRCAREENNAGFPFRGELARILSMVTRNGEALAAQLRRARARQEALNQSKQNLQRIQRSYVRPQSRAAWHSYS